MLVALLILALSSCAHGSQNDTPKAIAGESAGPSSEEFDDTDLEDFYFGKAPKFTEKYLELSYEAISAADEYIDGITAPDVLEARFSTIYIEMGIEYMKNEKQMTASASICKNLVYELEYLVTKDDDESREVFISVRNQIAEISEKCS